MATIRCLYGVDFSSNKLNYEFFIGTGINIIPEDRIEKTINYTIPTKYGSGVHFEPTFNIGFKLGYRKTN